MFFPLIFFVFSAASETLSSRLNSTKQSSISSNEDHLMAPTGSVLLNVILPVTEPHGLVIDKPGIQENRDQVARNSVNFTDTNLIGFNPFVIEPQLKEWGTKGLLSVVNILSFLAPVMITTPFIGDFGVAVMFFLQGIQVGFQPNFADEEQIFQGSVGAVQSSISSLMDNQAVSKLVSNMQTLSQNVNDQAVSYLKQLGVGKNSTSSLKAMVNGSQPIPWVFAKQVDASMKAIDSVLSTPNNWYISADSVLSHEKATDAFALTTGAGGLCLHSRIFLSDGAEIIADRKCNLNSMQDKLWAIGENNRLFMRTDFGDKCVTYKSTDGKDFTKALAIYDVSSPQCTSGAIISLKSSPIDQTWALYDGDQELCLSSSTMTKKSSVFNGVVNTKSHKRFWGLKTQNKCKSHLRFSHMIPVLINNQKLGGVAPPVSFSEIGVQTFYFTHFAGFHLAALKELYIHGTQKSFAKSQYYLKIAQYHKWIDTFVPVFKEYAQFARINASKEIAQITAFGAGLKRANLDYVPLRVPL